MTSIPNAMSSVSYSTRVFNELASADQQVIKAGSAAPGVPFCIVRTAGRTEPSRGFRRRALVFVCGRDITSSDPDFGLEKRLNGVLMTLDSNGHLIVGTSYIPVYDHTVGMSVRRYPAIVVEIEEAE